MLVDNSSINSGAIPFPPLLGRVIRKHKHAVGNSGNADSAVPEKAMMEKSVANHVAPILETGT